MIHPVGGGAKPPVPLAGPAQEAVKTAAPGKNAAAPGDSAAPAADAPAAKPGVSAEPRQRGGVDDAVGRMRVADARLAQNVGGGAAEAVESMNERLRSRRSEGANEGRFHEAENDALKVYQSIPKDASRAELTRIRDAFRELHTTLKDQTWGKSKGQGVKARQFVEVILENLDKRIQQAGDGPAPEPMKG